MKKKLAIVLAMALLCIMAVGTTLTYFTDTTAVDKNTMTVGNVKIEQVEDFDAGAKLLPYNGDPTKTGFAEELNAVTKPVSVKNIGFEAAYIRTLFAFEGVKYRNAADYVDPVAKGIIHVEYSDATIGTWTPMGKVIVDGATYYAYSFTYAAVVGKDATTAPSLKAIALDCKQDNAFFDAVGDKYDVLVLSQAVQTAGFTGETAVAKAFAAAFPYGDNNEALEDWFNKN